MSLPSPIWIFGYGSLLWKHSHPSTDTRVCFIEGFTRRLWQGSPDHRGTAQRPGRVATLVSDPGETCWGMAQRIPSEDVEATLDTLDIREKAGYERLNLPLYGKDGVAWGMGLTYRAAETNPYYLGPAGPDEIADHVTTCRGPSGSNTEYVLRLAAALQGLDIADSHIESVAQSLQRKEGFHAYR